MTKVVQALLGISFLGLWTSSCTGPENHFLVLSPNSQISMEFELTDDGVPFYLIAHQNQLVVHPSELGVKMTDADLSTGLKIVSVSPVKEVRDEYTMQQGKKKEITYIANEQTYHLQNKLNQPIDVVFRVSDDGVAFRYEFPESGSPQTITDELTTFTFAPGSKMYVQPMSVAKTGWAQSNPSYEEHYQEGIPVGTPASLGAGWVYPALFQSGDNWVLITETGLGPDYCGTRLLGADSVAEMKIGFPSDLEVFTGQGTLPVSDGHAWHSPWRIIAVGSLKTIVESTLGTDLAEPAIGMDLSMITPGYASWSWALLKDNSVNDETSRQFIDYAHDMNWQYCLIDVDWDTRIGWEKIRKLVDYATEKNVGIILWYNSSGDWNTTPYHPRNELLTHDLRVEEFGKLRDMGVKGVKIDFFGGDGQSMIAYYHDILKDAAAFGLMVNFHGATLPRGWQRTYPHLLTMEAIRGFEYITFGQETANLEPSHASMLPYTRNAFDPMDFTPMCFSDIPNIQRKTTNAFELALPTLFLSGIQHLAEIPEGMAAVPEYVRTYLSELPTHWDETRFIEGFPGKLAVIARRANHVWYVSAINGEDQAKALQLDLSFMGEASGLLITDGADHPAFSQAEVKLESGKPFPVTLKPNGGLVMKLISK